MEPVCRRAADNLHTRVEETALLYKEWSELLRQRWREHQPASPELFRLGPGDATRNLATTDEVSS